MQADRLIITAQRIPPVRGIITAGNRRGIPLPLMDLKRWLRVIRVAHGVHKADAYAHGALREDFPELLEHAKTLHMGLSLRSDASASPPDLGALAAAGLLDLFLTPPGLDAPHLDAWCAAAQSAKLPVRLQLQSAMLDGCDAAAVARRLIGAGAAAVNLVLEDPLEPAPEGSGSDGAARLKVLLQLVAALAEGDVEVNLIGVPFCQVPKELWRHVLNEPQFYLDHQQYNRQSLDIAVRLFDKSPVIAGKAILSLLTVHTVNRHSSGDRFLLPWLLHRPRLHAYVWAFHKLTRHLKRFRGTPEARPEGPEQLEAAAEKFRAKQEADLAPVCKECSLRRICDGPSAVFKKRLPGLEIEAQPGELIVSPMHFLADQPKYYDAVDTDRIRLSDDQAELVRQANDIITNHLPDREIQSDEYEIEGQWTHHMPNANRWYGYTAGEKLSTVLGDFEAPFTISITFGGGIAEYVGFALNRHCRLLCPMETHTHRVALHVDRGGHYVLLRDGEEVRPMTFESTYYAPLRLGTHLQPRICVWNVDGAIVTQTVVVWHGDRAKLEQADKVKYSVVIVSSRFTRRLQAVLRNLAHQQGIDLRQIEVIICYAPGIDATDDLIDSAMAAYPNLRIVRSPVPEMYAQSKGMLINESALLARGEWVVLLDSDIILPPDWFARMDAADDPETAFIVPDGRKMVSPETTGKILIGEIDPWDCYEDLLTEAGEYRFKEAEGVPVGFCQCVRRSCFDRVQYLEYDHFEGADWLFAVQVRENFGMEKRLTGKPVLHLDHGGSQWYGTGKHR